MTGDQAFAVPEGASGHQVWNKRRWLYAPRVAKLWNSLLKDITNTRSLPVSKGRVNKCVEKGAIESTNKEYEEKEYKEKRAIKSIKTEWKLGRGWEWKESSRDVFWHCCLSIFFFGQCCTEYLVREITDLTPCSCLCTLKFKSNLRRTEGMIKLPETSKLKPSEKQCGRCCDSAWLSEKMADEIRDW